MNQRKLADQVLDKLDLQGKYFKNRFYKENCRNCNDGYILKDMSVIQSLLDGGAETMPAQQAGVLSRLFKRTTSPIIVNIMN